MNWTHLVSEQEEPDGHPLNDPSGNDNPEARTPDEERRAELHAQSPDEDGGLATECVENECGHQTTA